MRRVSDEIAIRRAGVDVLVDCVAPIRPTRRLSAIRCTSRISTSARHPARGAAAPSLIQPSRPPAAPGGRALRVAAGGPSRAWPAGFRPRRRGRAAPEPQLGGQSRSYHLQTAVATIPVTTRALETVILNSEVPPGGLEPPRTV